MDERDFTIELGKSVKKTYPDSHVWRPSDNFTLGIPDVLAVIPNRKFLAVEAKQLQRLLADAFDPGRRKEPLLHHPFTGPQISVMKSLERAGAEVWGIVRVTREHAFRISVPKMPSTGNFTHEELVAAGELVTKGKDGWIFWQRDTLETASTSTSTDSLLP